MENKMAYEIPVMQSFSMDEIEEHIIASATSCPLGTTFTCGVGTCY